MTTRNVFVSTRVPQSTAARFPWTVLLVACLLASPVLEWCGVMPGGASPLLAQDWADDEDDAEDNFDADTDDDAFLEDDDADTQPAAPAGQTRPSTAPAGMSVAESLRQNKFGQYFPPGQRQFGDAGVEAILATDPQTAAALVRAGKLIANLDRMEIAKAMFRQAVAVKPTDAEIYDMVMEHGQPFFAALAHGKKYGAEGKALGQVVLDCMERRFQDETILKTVIKQLSHRDVNLRRQAFTELQGRSGIAIPVLLWSLVDKDMQNGRQEIEQALLSFGSRTTDAIGAVLDSDETALKTACVRLLAMQAAQNNTSAIRNLFLAAASRDQDSEPVRQAAYRAISGAIRQPMPDNDDTAKAIAEFLLQELETLSARLAAIQSNEKTDTSVTVVWMWNADAKKPVSIAKSTEDSVTLQCYRFARMLWKLCPDVPSVRQNFMRFTLEQTVRAESRQSEQLLKTPAFKAIREGFSLADVESLLTYTLHRKMYTAALGAVVLLGEMGDESLLVPETHRPGAATAAGSASIVMPLSPMVTALNSPSRAVRFAAMEAVMKWNPQKPYPGSQLLIDNLAWFLSTTGKAKVLVTGNNVAEASLLGGRFTAFGFYYDTATSGREAIIHCQASSDYAFLLVGMETTNPSPAFLTQSLRQDMKLADIPVVFVANSEHFREAQRLASNIPQTAWFPRPTNASDVEMLISLVARLQGYAPTSDLQRLEETRKCLQWAEKIVSSHRGAWVKKIGNLPAGSTSPVLEVYDISKLQTPVTRLMSINAYTADVVKVLAWMGTPASQRMLLSFASGGTQSLDLRKECVLALAVSVEHFGVLLNGSEVAVQYDIYNETPESDKDSRIIRDVILTVLEIPLSKNAETKEASATQ